MIEDIGGIKEMTKKLYVKIGGLMLNI